MSTPTPIISAKDPIAGAANYQNQLRIARPPGGSQLSMSDWPTEGAYSQSFYLEANPGSAAPKLVPAGNGNIDIVKDFKWTYSKFRDEVPRILLIERQIKQNQQLDFYYRTATNIGESVMNGKDPYSSLYGAAKRTGFVYTFPYYATNTVHISQSWSSSVPAESDLAGGLVSGVAEGLDDIIPLVSKFIKGAGAVPSQAAGIYSDKFGNYTGAPMFGYEQPQYYAGPSTQSFNVKFPLYNTDTVEDIRRNFDFIKVFGYQNLFERKSFATSLPPVIYECEFSSGHIGTIAAKPAVYVSKFDAKNIGAIRSIDLGIGSNVLDSNGNTLKTNVLIPEAYMIDITFTELIATSRNIFSSFITGQSLVNVYED